MCLVKLYMKSRNIIFIELDEKYYDVAIEVAKRTPVMTEQVLLEISKVISALTGFGYSKEKIDESITVEHIENIVMKKVAKARY